VPQDEAAAVQVEEQLPQGNALLHEALSLFDATIVEVKEEEGSREEVGKHQKPAARKK
jgi:hypothetical protein